METFRTPYGDVTLYANEVYIGREFKEGRYWDEDTLMKLRAYVPPHRPVLEIGGHCGTSSLVYASFLQDQPVYVYEPQRKMYNLLVFNVVQNRMERRIFPRHQGVFCYEGVARMNATDLDGGGGNVAQRYTEEAHLPCNFGGISLGASGEEVECTTIDAMGLEDVGFVHCDAQGAENFIFSKGQALLRRCRPVVYFEDNAAHGRYLYDTVCRAYPQYETESLFDVKRFCMDELGYRQVIERFNGGIDTLLVP